MARHSDSRPKLHGQKRPIDDDLEGEQPLAKKLGRLHLGVEQLPRLNGGDAPARPTVTTAAPPYTPERSSWTDDSMLLDDTKDKVYIHDLDKEIEDLETEERDVAFLPEIEKRLTAIPKSVLRNTKPVSNELVLYRLPTSLTVSEDKDSVRKAVADSRRHAQEANSRGASSTGSNAVPNAVLQDSKVNSRDAVSDVALGNSDAMDIDDE